MIVVMLGPPGAGKGTQAALMAAAKGMIHLSTGDLFREHLKNGTPLGQQAKDLMRRGELVPDAVVIDMVEDRLDKIDGPVVLDGFPRTVPQAEALDAYADARPHRSRSEIVAIQLAVGEEVTLRRLTGRWVCRADDHIYHLELSPPLVPGVCDKDGSPLYQRADDSEETVQHRLDVYDAETGPVIDYYARSGRLREVYGEADRDTVGERMMAVLAEAEA